MKKLKKSKNAAKNQRLPASFQHMFWSYPFGDLNKDEDASLIIKQILSYGDLSQWKWMMRQYGTRKIKGLLSRTPETALRPSLVELSKTVFDVTSMPHARRVPHRRS
ncbi:hypothetical protein HYV71_01830 [Candidatus Uhrbacteria bacterium]|nr:hypothetical protein [Candidatus Uhrbacteria bacterium]